MWALFVAGELSLETELTEYCEQPKDEADVDSELEEFKATFAEEQRAMNGGKRPTSLFNPYRWSWCHRLFQNQM
jgi:hypothetical protein